MEKRFAQILEQDNRMKDVVREFQEAALHLAKEIAEKGFRGEEITEKELKFIKAQTMLGLEVIVRRADR